VNKKQQRLWKKVPQWPRVASLLDRLVADPAPATKPKGKDFADWNPP
jgi:hypothetical protein